MTFQKLNNPNGFRTNLGPLQSKNNSDCHQSVFFKKKFDLFYINQITEHFKSKLNSDRSYWLPN